MENVLKSIINYYEYSPLLSAGGQPTMDQIKALKESGVEVIFNISPASTRNYLQDEPQITEALKIFYIHFPIDCSHLQEIYFKTFRSIYKSIEDKKVFIHCGGNIKASNFLHMYFVLEKGMDENASLEILKKIQNPEEKWFTYFKQCGMKGIC